MSLPDVPFHTHNGIDSPKIPASSIEGTTTTSTTPTSGVYAARVYNTVPLYVNSAIDTKITFDTEVFDTHSFHSTTTNPERFTAPVDGYYNIHGQAWFTGGNAGAARLTLEKNEVPIARVYEYHEAFNSNQVCVSAITYMSAGDYVHLRLYQVYASSISTDMGEEQTSFSIFKL